jgi:hypothetical protein
MHRHGKPGYLPQLCYPLAGVDNSGQPQEAAGIKGRDMSTKPAPAGAN